MTYKVWHIMYYVWYIMYDIWRMTYDVWNTAYDVWHIMYEESHMSVALTMTMAMPMHLVVTETYNLSICVRLSGYDGTHYFIYNYNVPEHIPVTVPVPVPVPVPMPIPMPMLIHMPMTISGNKKVDMTYDHDLWPWFMTMTCATALW